MAIKTYWMGIDVSRWQGIIDWDAVAESGITFAIIKAGGSDNGLYTDPYFARNFAHAKAVGLHVGAYYYVGHNFLTYSDGAADAKRFCKILEGRELDMPVYLDLESTAPSDKAGATIAAASFMDYMERSGYYTGIYASDVAGFKDRLEDCKLQRYAHWVARYGSEPKVVKNPGMWQYTDKGLVPGIKGCVDCDRCYVDYPSIIKRKKFNNYK